MKLFIQIPCFNEEATIAAMVHSLPAAIDGVDEIVVVVIDDGSKDHSAQRARACGAQVVTLERHRGLAAAFTAGIDYALQNGADIVVNTDADMQYPSSYIPDLIRPVLEKRADFVVGNRLHTRPAGFSFVKYQLECLGSAVLRVFSRVPVRDAASGFRAFNRAVMEAMVIHERFSYTLESIILAGVQHFRVENVPITITPTRRKSRLMRSVHSYIVRSAITMLRIYLMYHPLSFFLSLAACFFGGALFLGGRFLYYFFTGSGGGHIQSLILLAVFAVGGFMCTLVGLVADVVAANRRLLEEIRRGTIRQKNG